MDDIDAIHSQATATMETAMEHHFRNAASFLDDLDATMATALRDGYGAAPPNDDYADDDFEAPAQGASNAGIRNADHYWRVVKDAPGHDNWKLYSPSKTNARGARY
ncbi:hypothetical protein JL720_16694 [Aureococcus anophagefferens]|nr:hypothetical protein JL720_16694 [Aureococcus anophagefferens]